MSAKRTVTLIYGDGIGPEVVMATRKIINAAGAKITWEECEAGAAVFKKGLPSGVPLSTIESIQKNKVALKGPLETPVGFGEKSANVTIRKLFGTFGNIRPVREFPNVTTPFSGLGVDLIVVRENVEDLYAGIEYMQTPGVANCLKLISKKGCEKICRLAFEIARAHQRRLVTCATKSNIMKLTEGLMKHTFEEVAKDYPDLEADHIIIDNCAHQLVRFPEKFDVIVTTNMNGDILSDLCSGLVGGLGFAPGANIGTEVSIFEAVHGSAPKYAGKNVINPTAVILSGIMMLRHIDEFDTADLIEKSLFYTLEQGYCTQDVKTSDKPVSTTEFTDLIIKHFGKTPKKWGDRKYKKLVIPSLNPAPDYVQVHSRNVRGVDVFVESNLRPHELGQSLEGLMLDMPLKLEVISNLGVKVYPQVGVIPDVIDHYGCRFKARNSDDFVSDAMIVDLLNRLSTKHRWMHIEKLYTFDNIPGFTKAQGED